MGTDFFIVEGESVVRLPQKTLKNRKPARVVRIDTHRIKVDSEGAMNKEHFGEGMRLALARGFGEESTSSSIGANSNVVDAKQLFDERRWKQHHPEISGPALKKILTDLSNFFAEHMQSNRSVDADTLRQGAARI